MLGHKAVLLVGDAPYYARFGFEAALTTGLALPGPVDRARFLAFEIVDPGALDGAEGMVRPASEAAFDAARRERESAAADVARVVNRGDACNFGRMPYIMPYK